MIFIVTLIYNHLYNSAKDYNIQFIYAAKIQESPERMDNDYDIPYELLITHRYKTSIPKQIIDSWRKYHPQLLIHIFDNQDCEKYIKQYGNEISLEIFKFLKYGPIKADYFRIFYLYHNGGIYGDADIDVNSCIDEYMILARNNHFVTVQSGNGKDHTNPTLIITGRHNHICHKLLILYHIYYENKIPYHYWRYSVVKMINRLIRYSPNDKDSIVLPFIEKYYWFAKFNTIHDKNTNKKIFKNKISSYHR